MRPTRRRAAARRLRRPASARSPDRASWQHGSFRAGKRWLAGRDDEPEGHATIPVTTSELFDCDLPSAVVTTLLDHLTANGARRHTRQMTLTPLGGAYNRAAPTATAFAHRRQRFILEHTVAAPRPELSAARAWARRAWAIGHRVGTGRVYPNFPDPQLRDPATAYHGENLARLRQIKRRYDPERSFRFHQSL
jgi:FAD/FMN-containing dehydrogenase